MAPSKMPVLVPCWGLPLKDPKNTDSRGCKSIRAEDLTPLSRPCARSISNGKCKGDTPPWTIAYIIHHLPRYTWRFYGFEIDSCWFSENELPCMNSLGKCTHVTIIMVKTYPGANTIYNMSTALQTHANPIELFTFKPRCFGRRRSWRLKSNHWLNRGEGDFPEYLDAGTICHQDQLKQTANGVGGVQLVQAPHQ